VKFARKARITFDSTTTGGCLHLPSPNQVSSSNYWEAHCLTLTSSALGESPPPPPRARIGRDELIAKMVGLAENLPLIALVGAGGIGKRSIALTDLHHDCIRKRFRDNTSLTHKEQIPRNYRQWWRS